jgi:hypothetical protein
MIFSSLHKITRAKIVNMLAFVLVIFCVQSARSQIAQSDMASKIDGNKITLLRAPLVNVPSQITSKLIERQKARFPKFKESMWYYHYVVTNGFYNIVFYDWTADECQYFTFKKEALEKKDQEVKAFLSNPSHGSTSARVERMPIKVCEKLYNFYSEKRE